MRASRSGALLILAVTLVGGCADVSECNSGLVPGGGTRSAKLGHVVIALDRSSSMQPLAEDVVNNFNQMLDVLPDGMYLSLVQFDSLRGADVTHSIVPIGEMQPLSMERYVPDGGTPLYDAVAQAISLGTRGESLLGAAGPIRTVIAIISDGAENSSVYTSLPELRSVIADRLATGWEVRFFGLGQSASAEAAKLGLPASSTSELGADGGAIGDVFGEIGVGFAASRARC